MARLKRRWQVAKWAGLVLSLLIVMAWAASMRWQWWYFRSNGAISIMSGQKVFLGSMIGLGSGSLCVGQFPVPSEQVGWNVRDAARTPRGELSCSVMPKEWQVVLPLWMCFLLVAVPTGVLFYLDRRSVPPHCCRSCGYDLTGNTSGTCPECGGSL